jgi:hypothetical protein
MINDLRERYDETDWGKDNDGGIYRMHAHGFRIHKPGFCNKLFHHPDYQQ